MEDGTEERGAVGTDAGRFARLVPVQKRSRERFERILVCATDVMAEKGSDGFRMSDIVERTGIAFGSLYQYFPDKTAIIGTLAERYNAIGHDCVRREVSAITGPADLHAALCRITDAYYQLFLDAPVMRDIWQATQAERDLQKLDEDDGIFLAGILTDALRNVAPDIPDADLSIFSQTMMILIAATVRHAITLPPQEARQVLIQFEQMLPSDLSLVSLATSPG